VAARDPTPPRGQDSAPALRSSGRGGDLTAGEVTEEDLLDRIRRGDQRAFDRLAYRVTPTIRSVAGRLAGSPETAEEIVQDTLVRLYRSPPTLHEGVALRTWLFRVTLNLTRDAQRREARTPRSVPLDGVATRSATVAPEAPSRIATEERARWIAEAMGHISPAAREVLALRYEGDLEYKEIADVLGCSVGTVGSRLHRALRDLGDALSRILPHEEAT